MAPVLRYFDLPGRAVVIRLAFALTGQEFEDKRFTRDEWTAEKPNAPFLQVPYVTLDDGVKLPQTYAILFYVFDKAGKLPACPLARAMNWSVCLQLDDVFVPIMRQWYTTPEEGRAAILPELFEKAKAAVPTLEKFVAAQEGGRGHFHSNVPSPADLAICSAFKWGATTVWGKDQAQELIKDAPAIKRIVEHISALPAVSSHRDVQPPKA